MQRVKAGILPFLHQFSPKWRPVNKYSKFDTVQHERSNADSDLIGQFF